MVNARCSVLDVVGVRVFAGVIGPVVGEFVELGADMAADPDELDIVGLVEPVELLDEVEILDFAAFFMPIIGGPGGGPFGENVDPKFGIGVDFAGFIAGELNGGDEGVALHADVGGVAGVTEFDGFPRVGVDDGVAAGAGIGVGAAVGPEYLHGAIITYMV